MSLITPADVNALNAGGGLDDADLQTIIDREEAELVRRFGANYSASPITVTRPGGAKSIYLNRAIGAITSIAEYSYLGDTAPTTLTSADYFIWSDQGRIERLSCHWGAYAVVVYTPVDDTELRKQVLIELVRVNANQTLAGKVSGLGYTIEATQSAASYKATREAQYGRLAFIGV
jgi:hypothetical protein